MDSFIKREIRTSCFDCTLYDLCIPHYLDDNEFNLFENSFKRSRLLQKGDALFKQGDLINSLYIIRTGSVKEYVNSNDGEEEIFGFYLPKEIVGLSSIGKDHYHCSAKSLETTTYCSFPLNKFEQMCQQSPKLQTMMFNTMSKAISFDNKMLLSACNKKANGRMATFLRSLSKRYANLGYSAKEIHLPMSRQEIGNYLGLTSETISRVFTKLQKENFISLSAKMITIKNMEALKELSQSCSAHKSH